jgi:hypothetical protein
MEIAQAKAESAGLESDGARDILDIEACVSEFEFAHDRARLRLRRQCVLAKRDKRLKLAGLGVMKEAKSRVICA